MKLFDFDSINRLLNLFRSNETLTTREKVNALKFNKTTAKRKLSKLVVEGKTEKLGKKITLIIF